ncbi:MAG: hypothetical protein RIC30_18855 [Marinoscillum sp.]|uniref:hypothetical protein n=1 Tax=Marinoscillum sp. TaxID=2024838 RepID=UPI0032F22B52
MLDFQKKKQLSILVKIAMVDEDFADAEKEVIRKISQKYGATEEELAEIFNSPATAESLAPMTLIDKMDFMMDCILVVIADDMVTSSEEYFARQMATRLGFNQDVVAFLIKNKDVSREEMRELMLPYLVK